MTDTPAPSGPPALPIDFQALFERSPNPYMVLDRELRFVAVNAAYLAAVGRSREDLIGQPLLEAFPATRDSDNGARLEASLRRVLETGEPDVLGVIHYPIVRQTPGGPVTGGMFWSATHTPLPDAHGDVGYVLQNTMDITELHQLKAELQHTRRGLPFEQMEASVFLRARAAEQRNSHLDEHRRHLLKLLEQAPGFIAFLSGPRHVFELTNRAYQRLVGHRDLIGLPAAEAIPEPTAQGYFDLLDRVYRSGEAFVGHGMVLQLQAVPGGPVTDAVVDFVYQPVRDADGRVVGIFVQGHDMTAQARAQAELAEYRRHLEELVEARTRALEERESELERAELALLQSQKMEAIGNLTGGVAHDFNNVLQVIGANLELLVARSDLGPGALARAQAAMDGVSRGANLASQLLTFARRQPLNPVVFNIGEKLHALREMLQRTLGDNRPITLALEVDVAVGNVEADAHLFENTLLNLAINARDAMPRGGTLRLACRTVDFSGDAELAPGRYVLVTVADTGQGMDDEVLRRAFEPFFTTKPVGKGTGLGMPMAYGFARQSGGDIRLHSELGVGTEVRIYLPASPLPVSPLEAPPVGGPPRGHETILLVEDDDAVREGVGGMLKSLGYRVLEAADANAALTMVEAGARIDLLFTDMVMPGELRSPEMAERARRLLPRLLVLFTSGYSEHEIFHGAHREDGVELLVKPYRLGDLARRIRDMLDHRPAAPEPAGADTTEGALRILFVDDCADTRLLTGEMLRLLGHHVVAVGDADAARQQLARHPWDLLLTDVELPGDSGVELVGHARRQHPQLRTVYVTGHDADALRDRADDSPVLQKPYQIKELEAVLRPPR